MLKAYSVRGSAGRDGGAGSGHARPTIASGAEPHLHHVQRPRPTVGDGASRLMRIEALKIGRQRVACSRRNEAERRPRRVRGHQAVDSFVQRAVSARHHDGIASPPRQRGEQLARVAGPLRFHQLQRAAGSAQDGLGGRPRRRRRAAARVRIEHDEQARRRGHGSSGGPGGTGAASTQWSVDSA